METLKIKTNSGTEFLDITGLVEQIVRKSGVKNGICYVFCPHTTAAITINENADPDVRRDILNELEKVVPTEDDYAHAEGNSAAHIKSSLVGASEIVIVNEHNLALGTWQAIFFCEFDGPRSREVFVEVIGK